MPKTDVPAREQLVKRASDLVPLLKKHATWSEENRRIHEESIEALARLVSTARSSALSAFGSGGM